MTTSAPREFDCLYEERAAIMEYLGGLSRGEAEQKAWMICYRKSEMRRTSDGGTEFRYTLSAPKAAAPPLPKAAEQLELITREQYLEGIKRFL